MRVRYLAAALLAVVLSLACLRAEAARLTETGSSLLYPLLIDWIGDYTKSHPDVQIEAASTGSGYGIDQTRLGAVSFGASDAYLKDDPSSAALLNIPLAVSAQEITYNIPGVASSVNLKLSGDVLAQIYDGSVHYWDEPALTALNPGLKLPHNKIVTIRRSDSSGDTFLFTQYLTFASARWKSGPKFGTKIEWPAVEGQLTAKGNAGMVELCANAPNSIAYVGISFFEQTRAKGLGFAALQNHDGAFVTPTEHSISAAAAVNVKVPPDARLSLIYSPGKDAYPIVNFEYAVVRKATASAEAKDLAAFLSWIVSPTGGNSANHLAAVHFVALPDRVRKVSEALIAKVGAP